MKKISLILGMLVAIGAVYAAVPTTKLINDSTKYTMTVEYISCEYNRHVSSFTSKCSDPVTKYIPASNSSESNVLEIPQKPVEEGNEVYIQINKVSEDNHPKKPALSNPNGCLPGRYENYSSSYFILSDHGDNNPYITCQATR